MTSLDEFAASSGKSDHNRCKTCALPTEVREQVEAGRTKEPPIGWTTISKWLLQEHGVAINPPTIRNHFVLGHVSE